MYCYTIPGTYPRTLTNVHSKEKKQSLYKWKSNSKATEIADWGLGHSPGGISWGKGQW